MTLMNGRIFLYMALCLCLCCCGNRGREHITYSEYDDTRNKFNAEYSSMDEAEEKLLEILESRYGKPEESSKTYRFYHEVTDLVLNDPETIDHPFNDLQELGYINIVTSEDGNLRLYYWDTEFGGTWIQWANICQYRSNGKTYVYEGSIMDVKYVDMEKQDEMPGECAVLGIKTIYDTEGSPIYLVHSYIRESSNLGYASIEAVKIENDRLTGAPIFRGGNDYDETDWIDESNKVIYECSRGTDYSIADWYFRANNGEGWNWLFRYDDETDILYIPQASFEITDRYSLFRYNGKTLNHIGTDRGFWLHPSIRSFEFMELVIDTKDYRIRVDRMLDGSYRYAAWNDRGSMENEPDIILYDGTLDEVESTFVFKSKGYEYIVDEIDGLIVKQNGKTILSQDRYLI